MKKIIVFIFPIIFVSCFNQTHLLKKDVKPKTERIIKLEKLSNDVLNYLISQLQISNFDNLDLKAEIEIIDPKKLKEEKLRVEEWDNINSWFGYPDRIYIQENFFKLLQNETELAAILCHELGHVYYTHIFSVFNLEIESEADIFAIDCLKKSNYNIDSLKIILKKLFKIFLKGYPNLEKIFSKRIENIDLYIKQNKIKTDGKLFIIFNKKEFKSIVNQ